jgi:putative addiction module antidote
MYELNITKVGNSSAVILPKELMEKLGVVQGDKLFITASPTGVNMSSYNPEVAAQVQAGLEIMDRYRNTFAELAK